MANAAGAQFIMPVHHQTFRLSFEPLREPIERFETALQRKRPSESLSAKSGKHSFATAVEVLVSGASRM